jgi:hypothetical protein
MFFYHKKNPRLKQKYLSHNSILKNWSLYHNMISKNRNILTKDQIIEIADFVEKYPTIYSKIIKTSIDIPPINIVHKMAKNWRLANQVYNKDIICDRYFDLDHALTKLTDEHILVMIEELGIFCLFNNMDSFAKLCSRIYNNIYGVSPADITFAPYQIILSNSRQKIVFIAKGSKEDIDSIVEICKKEMDADILVEDVKDHIEITIQISVDNAEQTKEAFNKFALRMNFYNEDLVEKINLAPISIVNDYKKDFIMPYVGQNKMDDYDYNSLLKFIPPNSSPITVNFNYIIKNNVIGNKINGNDNVISINKKPSKSHEIKAKNWISANLPINGMHTQTYYDNYKSALPQDKHIRIPAFNDIVMTNNYLKTTNKDRKQVWEKKQ